MIKRILIIALFVLPAITSCSQKVNQFKVLNDLKELSSDAYEGRKVDTKGGEKAAEFIIKRYHDLGLSTYNQDYKQAFTFTGKDGQIVHGKNIIGYIKGKTDQVIVVSAHYDHLGVIKGEVYNGTDDNASGTCGLLAFAEYFSKHQPQHTLIFAAFDAEEEGLQGSKYFVNHPPIVLSQIGLNINMDMIAHNDKNELYACGTFEFPELRKFVFTTSDKPKILFGHDDPKLGHDDWTDQSDQGSFYAKKIPFIYFGVEDHKDYHQPTDEFKNINQEFYVNSVKAILQVIKNFDKNYSVQTVFKNNQIMN